MTQHIANARRRALLPALVAISVLASPLAMAQAQRQFSFAYDQPPTTAYGIAGNSSTPS